jgi:hypothetical protein
MMHKQRAVILLDLGDGVAARAGILELVLDEFEVDRRRDSSLIWIQCGASHGFKRFWFGCGISSGSRASEVRDPEIDACYLTLSGF